MKIKTNLTINTRMNQTISNQKMSPITKVTMSPITKATVSSITKETMSSITKPTSPITKPTAKSIMKTTVVIPNYNGMKFIENCLNSIYREENKNFHVVVVDNGSKDGSLELIKNEFPQIELIELEENQGFCNAVNLGIEASRTKFVLLLNNDTEIEAGFIQAMEEAIELSEDIFSVSAKMVTMDNPNIMDGAGDCYCGLGWAFAIGKGKPTNKYNKRKKIFSACGGAVIYQKKVLNEIGYFDENHFAYLEDVDIGYRAKIYGYTNWYEPKAVVKHIGSGASGSRYNEFKITQSSKNSIYLIYKNMPVVQIIINSPFLLLGFIIKIAFFCKKGYGRTYVKGLLIGLRACSLQPYKEQKVRFEVHHLGNYSMLQLELWWNILRKITGK